MGKFIRAKTSKYAGVIPLIEAEARAILEATRWIRSMGIHNVDIESDSLNTVHSIKRATENYLEVGVIFQECGSLLDARKDISISFVKK